MSDFATSSVLVVGLILLMVYLFATNDNQYVMIADRPKPWESQRQSINNYAWRGPMFVEDFRNFTGDNNPLNEVTPTGACCKVPKYNKNVDGALECNELALNSCRIPTLTAEESWRNEYHNSPYNLSRNPKKNFSQITNNNLSAANNLKSAQMRSVMGDWFDPKDKISPWCYAETYDNCSAK